MLITLKLLDIKINFKQQIIRGLKALSDCIIRFDLKQNFQGQFDKIQNFTILNAYNS